VKNPYKKIKEEKASLMWKPNLFCNIKDAMYWWNFEGLIRRTREGGSELEPIRVLLEEDGNSNKMNTASNTRL
jgi:hypothetical protein